MQPVMNLEILKNILAMEMFMLSVRASPVSCLPSCLQMPRLEKKIKKLQASMKKQKGRIIRLISKIKTHQ